MNWQGIVLHHTDSHDVSVKTVDKWHKDRGFGIDYMNETYHVGYNFLVHKDGTFETGRPLLVPGAHAKGYNKTHIGIAFLGNFNKEEPTSAQYDTGAFLCIHLMFKHKFKLNNILLHKEVGDTECPGKNFDRQEIFNRIAHRTVKEAEQLGVKLMFPYTEEEKPARDPKSFYEVIGTTHIITTTPDNIEIKVIRQTLQKAGVNGINGTFFDVSNPSDTGRIWGIAVNNGSPIGSGYWTNKPNTPRGTLICDRNYNLRVERVYNIKSLDNVLWAISGGMLFPDYDPKKEGFRSDVIRTTNHTGIGFRGNEVVMFVKPNCPLERLVLTAKNLNLEGAIFLDGGGSSQLNYQGRGIQSHRKICTAVCLKEV